MYQPRQSPAGVNQTMSAFLSNLPKDCHGLRAQKSGLGNWPAGSTNRLGRRHNDLIQADRPIKTVVKTDMPA